MSQAIGPSQRGPQREPRPLPHIPDEVLDLIAPHLDRVSAHALTLTCKSLRNAGEAALYRELAITSGWKVPNRDRLAQAPLLTDLEHSQAVVDKRSWAIYTALHAYPYRAHQVRHLRLEVSDGVSGALVGRFYYILHQVSASLERLALFTLDCLNARSSDRKQHIYDHLDAAKHFHLGPSAGEREYAFPKLSHLSLALPDGVHPHGGNVIGMLLSGSKQLKELHIEPSGGVWQIDRTSWTKAASIAAMDISLSQLETLVVRDSGMGTIGQDWVQLVLNMAPDLENLCMCHESGDDFYSFHDLAAARTAKPTPRHLKKLVLLSNSEEGDHARGMLPWITEVDVLVVDASGRGEPERMPDVVPFHLTFPHLPTIHSAVLLSHGDNPLATYASADIRPTFHSDAQSLFPNTAAQDYLESHPHCHTFLTTHAGADPFPSMHSPLPVSQQLPSFVPSERWMREGYRGAIARVYEGSLVDKAPFYHVRILSQHHPTAQQLASQASEEDRRPWEPGQRHWIDKAHYRGIVVPSDMLDEVYAAAHMERRWDTGGRGLELPHQAWRLLKTWRDGCGV